MKTRAVAIVLALLASARPRAVILAGALLALLASTHRHALTAEVEFYWSSQCKNCADACACNETMPSRRSCVLQLFIAAVLSTQIELHTLTALCVKCTKIDSKDACRRIYMWAFDSRRLFACLVDVRVLTRLGSQGLLLATWAIALPFFPAYELFMILQSQRGCPGVRTACHAL